MKSSEHPPTRAQPCCQTLIHWRYRKHPKTYNLTVPHSNILRHIENVEDVLYFFARASRDICIQTTLIKDTLTISMSHRSQLVPITRLVEKSGRDQSGLRSFAFARPPLRRVLKKGCEAGWFKTLKKKIRKTTQRKRLGEDLKKKLLDWTCIWCVPWLLRFRKFCSPKSSQARYCNSHSRASISHVLYVLCFGWSAGRQIRRS